MQLVHGTDTMAHTASALSLMLQGFKKPIVMTGSQLPLASPRSDARQNLLGEADRAARLPVRHHACLHGLARSGPCHSSSVSLHTCTSSWWFAAVLDFLHTSGRHWSALCCCQPPWLWCA